MDELELIEKVNEIIDLYRQEKRCGWTARCFTGLVIWVRGRMPCEDSAGDEHGKHSEVPGTGVR